MSGETNGKEKVILSVACSVQERTAILQWRTRTTTSVYSILFLDFVVCPFRSKEIEFTVPNAPFAQSGSRYSRRNCQKLDIPRRSEQSATNLSPNRANTPEPTPSNRQRRFSSAFLLPTANGSASPLLSPCHLFHSSAPSSPLPACTPSPSHTPSPLPTLFHFFREQTPSPGRSRTPSPSRREERVSASTPSSSRVNSPILGSYKIDGQPWFCFLVLHTLRQQTFPTVNYLVDCRLMRKSIFIRLEHVLP